MGYPIGAGRIKSSGMREAAWAVSATQAQVVESVSPPDAPGANLTLYKLDDRWRTGVITTARDIPLRGEGDPHKAMRYLPLKEAAVAKLFRKLS
jgi:hypothetical protein